MNEVIIYRDKIKTFKKINPDVTQIRWQSSDLVKKVLKLFPNVTKLNCSDYGIKSLKPLCKLTSLTCLDFSKNNISLLKSLSNLTSLTRLDFWDNQVTSLKSLSNLTSLTYVRFSHNQVTSLEPLSNLTLLRDLHFGSNKVTSLEPLSNLRSLTYLSFGYNQIKSLEPLSNLSSLTYLYFNDNEITSLKPLSNLTLLTHLDFSDNQVTSLEPLSNLTSLTELYFNRNQVISLEPLSNLTSLTDLKFEDNQVTSLKPIIYLHNLLTFSCNNNPLEPPSVRTQRFLDRIQVNNNNRTVYSDTQNVHNTTIQRSVMNSVNNLMKDDKPEFTLDDIVNSDLQETTKTALIEYCQDKEYHCILLLTYQELLSYVWCRITKSPYKTELFKILEEAISDTLCKCFTGRFNRTLSVLCGFYDDIKVEISDNDRISAIILLTKKEVIPYTPEKHRELATIRLKEAGYDEKTTSTWVEYIE